MSLSCFNSTSTPADLDTVNLASDLEIKHFEYLFIYLTFLCLDFFGDLNTSLKKKKKKLNDILIESQTDCL